MKRYATDAERLEARRASRRRSGARHRAANNVRQRAYYAANRDRLNEAAKVRSYGVHLKKTYGITEAEYLSMLEAQGGRCAICGPNARQPRHFKRLCVDHDHATGKVRGLLCDRCNRLLGMVGENFSILRSAAYYLRSHQV